MPEALSAAVRARRGQSIEVGIRPEDVSLDARAIANAADLPAHVVVTEPLGAETLVTVRLGGQELVARARPDRSARPGEAITARFDLDRLHLFDPTSGEALR